MIPRVLRNFNLFLESVGYQGRVTECELPDLKVKTAEHQAGGLDGVAEIDVGMEAMTAKFTFAEIDAAVLKGFGRMNGNGLRLQVRGALQRDGETAIPVIAELHGGFKTSTLAAWKRGDIANHTAEMSVRYYRLKMGTEIIYEIDVDNCIRNIGGVDEMESIRAAIGL